MFVQRCRFPQVYQMMLPVVLFLSSRDLYAAAELISHYFQLIIKHSVEQYTRLTNIHIFLGQSDPLCGRQSWDQ